MRVLKVNFRQAINIGAKVETFLYAGCELDRLYSITYEPVGRFISLKSKNNEDEPATLIPMENVTLLQLSEDLKTEKPTKDSVNGGTKKK